MRANDTTAQSLEATTSQVTRIRGTAATMEQDWLAREEPLEIRVRGQGIAVTMRTPGHDIELAAGFLLSEGLIHSPDDIGAISHCSEGEANGNVVNVLLASHVRFDLTQLTRHVFASSSCGICGKASIDSVHQHFAPVTSSLRIDPAELSRLTERMRAAQPTFARTGGLHAAAVFDPNGNLLVLREDVGRHNAVDKVIGRALVAGGFPFDEHILLVSGRASFEILQKALAARVPLVCAVSAPSSLAVQFAEQSGQTLVGFLRDGSMNIYSHPERVATP